LNIKNIALLWKRIFLFESLFLILQVDFYLSHTHIVFLSHVNSVFLPPFRTRNLPRSQIKLDTHHDSVLLLASILGLVHIVVTVAFVILGYRMTLELTEPGKRSCLDEHFLETNRLVLRTIKHIRSILIEDDTFAHYVATLHYNEQRLQHIQTKNIFLRYNIHTYNLKIFQEFKLIIIRKLYKFQTLRNIINYFANV